MVTSRHFIVLWEDSPPKTYRHVLFRYNESRKWGFRGNWKCNLSTHNNLKYWYWNIIMPFFRFTKCNTKVEIGLGNHYVEMGW